MSFPISIVLRGRGYATTARLGLSGSPLLGHPTRTSLYAGHLAPARPIHLLRPSSGSERTILSLYRRLHTTSRLSEAAKPKKKADPLLNRFDNDGGRRVYDLTKWQTWKEGYWEHPKTNIFLTLVIIAFFALFPRMLYKHYYEDIKPLNRYPIVALEALRHAVHYEVIRDDKQQALEYYRLAIRQLMGLGFDRLSDDFTGLMIKYMEILEKAGVWEIIPLFVEKQFNHIVMGDFELRKGEITAEQRIRVLRRANLVNMKVVQAFIKTKELKRAEDLLEVVAANSLKLMGEYSAWLESNESLKEDWKEGDEGGPRKEIYEEDEFAALFNEIGNYYVDVGRFEYASAMYMQVLTLVHPRSCRAVLAMSNIGGCNMQRVDPKADAGTQEYQLQAAKQWLLKALEMHKTITVEEQTVDCSLGCAGALYNIGELEEQLGNIDEAAVKYKEADQATWWKGVGSQTYRNIGAAQRRISLKRRGLHPAEAEEGGRHAAKQLPDLYLPAFDLELEGKDEKDGNGKRN